jgi:FkbM family methyltransferase
MPLWVEKIKSALNPEYRRVRKDRWKYRWLPPLSIGTVLDIGANVGQSADRFRHILPDAQIYSFEPVKDCYDQLAARFRGDARFRAFHCALGESDSTAVIHRSAHRMASSLLEQSDRLKRSWPKAPSVEAENITVRALDDMAATIDMAPNILIKIDVEGYEDRVIRGGQKTIASAKVILMEMCFQELYEGQLLFDGLYDLLRPIGFTFRGFQGQAQAPDTGEIIFADAIFLK